MVKEELVTLSLPYRNGEKTVRVFVPEHEQDETLPVIYFADGQNLFEDDNVRFGCWYTREAVRAEYEKSGKAAVIVGIFSEQTELGRACELTPASIGRLTPPSGLPKEMMITPDGEAYDDFIIKTLMPVIEERFPVKKGAENTAFCGSSCGGLMSFYTALSHPDKYCCAGVFSPVPLYLVYAPEDVNNWICAYIKNEMPYLYMMSGSAEGMEKEICTGMKALYAFMKDKYPAGKISMEIKEGAPHHETTWSESFKDLLHLFLTMTD